MKKTFNLTILSGLFLFLTCCLNKRTSIETKHKNPYPPDPMMVMREYPSGCLKNPTLTDGTRIKLYYDPRVVFTITIEKGHSTFGTEREYFDSGKLKSEGPTFWGERFGIRKIYDESANLIKEENLDNNLKFTIDNVVKLMEDQFKKNLTVDTTLATFRIMRNWKTPSYIIEFPINSSWGGYLRAIIVNGEDGRITTNEIIKPRD